MCVGGAIYLYILGLIVVPPPPPEHVRAQPAPDIVSPARAGKGAKRVGVMSVLARDRVILGDHPKWAISLPSGLGPLNMGVLGVLGGVWRERYLGNLAIPPSEPTPESAKHPF